MVSNVSDFRPNSRVVKSYSYQLTFIRFYNAVPASAEMQNGINGRLESRDADNAPVPVALMPVFTNTLAPIACVFLF